MSGTLPDRAGPSAPEGDLDGLREAEATYRWLFVGNPAPMFIYRRGSLELLAFNEAFLALYGHTEEQARRLRLTDLYLPADRDTVVQRVAGFHGAVNAGQWRHVRRDGSLVHAVVQSHDIEYQGQACRLGVVSDVTALERSRERERQRLALLERLARGDPLESLLEQLALDHEAMFPGSLCSVLLLDASGRLLQRGAAPSLPASYSAALHGLPIGPDAGSCGAACWSGLRVVVADIESHPNWAPYRELARAAGLRACWSDPIVGSGGRVLGSFAVYRRHPAEPSAEELDHVQFAVQLAATAISHEDTTGALRRSERRLRGILHAIPDLVFLKDPQGIYQACNAAFERFVDRPESRIVGLADPDVTDAETARLYRAADAQALAQRSPVVAERWLEFKRDGHRGFFEVVKPRLFDEAGQPMGVLGIARDITERRRHEDRIERLNRSYSVLSSINEAVVRLRDRDTLFRELCRITVETGGFRLAWVGTYDDADESVRPVAWAGQADEYLQRLVLTITPQRRGPVPDTLRSGRPQVVPDVTAEPTLAHRRDALLAMDLRAMAVLPIAVPGGAWHCLAVYSTTGEHFDDEQVALLARLARDVAFALEFIAAEQARADAQHFREQIIESVAGLFFALDARGRLVLWNRRVVEVLGRDPTALAGTTVADHIAPADRDRVAAALEQGFAGGQAQVEARMLAADGTGTPYLLVARRLDTASGPLLAGTGIDISDRVHNEHELARYREGLEDLVRQRTAEFEAVNARLHREDRRLRAMLALSQRASSLTEDALFEQGLQAIVALTGSPAGAVYDASEGPAPRRRAGVGAEVVTMASLAATLARGGPPPAPLARLIGATAMVDDQVAIVVCVADKVAPYDDTDRRELQLLAADLWAIVQRRRTEIALGEAKAAADAANLAKSAFLANMSHEIRTPMNAIVGFAHLLRRDPLTARQQDHLGKITDAGQHLLQVINDILDFSKIEAHKVTLEEADFDLRESLMRVQALQADAARAKRLPLRLQIDARCPARVRGDPLRLEQVLLNLLSNAVKFTQQGHIELRVAPAAPPEPEPVLRFEVVDTGIGMTPDQASHVFEAFAQADASTTRRFGGTGLGLAISKRLVQLMQGRIGVDSRPGEGSTFWVQLPLPPAGGAVAGASAPMPALAAPAPPGLLRGKRILLAEDNPVNQEVAGTLLAALGAEVDLAATGREAVDRFAAGHHDLVLMDVQMPGMDGLSATAVIRSLPEGQTVPIVAMTANAFAEDRARCLAAGMNDHLAKPVEPRALEQCLLRWLAAAGPLPPAPPPALSADERLRQRLERLDVLDAAGALARLRGSWPLYLRMLNMFVSHHGSDDVRLADGARAGDAKVLRELAHALAGAAASIGATEVMQQARTLQAAMKADTVATPAADSALPLIDALQRCLHGLRAALAQADEAPPTEAAPADAAVREALLALQPLVAAHDTAALALFERHRSRIEAALGPDGRVLGEHLRSFSFGAAQAGLAQALALVDDQGA